MTSQKYGRESLNRKRGVTTVSGVRRGAMADGRGVARSLRRKLLKLLSAAGWKTDRQTQTDNLVDTQAIFAFYVYTPGI